ncbi:MAG: hypothetical protein AB1746_12715 [Candidatus Zixiibacteriota bacterium]
MPNDFNLTKLPPYGKLFVTLFCILVLFIVVWMTILGMMEARLIGDFSNEEQAFEEYDAQADLNTIELDDKAVTAPDWSDSGEQEPIDSETLDDYEEYAEDQVDEDEEALTFWEKFKENMEWAIEHLSTQTMIFFGLGLLFIFTTYSAGVKKFFLWFPALLIFLHALGISGYDFCWPAKFFIWVCGPLLLITLFIMSLMILTNVRKKG